jgi:hypothetical protein
MIAAPRPRQVGDDVALFRCLVCGGADVRIVVGRLFGCDTLAAFCTMHGEHWVKRSAQVAAAEGKP